MLMYLGDLGQTYDSNQTFEHYVANRKGQAVLFLGDLSYADDYEFHDNRRWDSWAKFVEKSVAYQPWIWTAGNHELDYAPEIVRLSLSILPSNLEPSASNTPSVPDLSVTLINS